ncbi:MAG: DUF1330 domain-containing protein [Pseudomonadota bacterium]
MAAYMLIAAKIHDRERFVSGYGKAAAELVAEYGGRYVVLAPGAELLEGSLAGYSSVAVSEWPNRQRALDFWNSDAYADIKKLREGIADVEVILVGD